MARPDAGVVVAVIARSWWLARTRCGVVYLDLAQGDQLAEVFAAHIVSPDRRAAWRGVDICGQDVLIGLDDIVTMESSTPEGREQERDPDGPLEECRRWSLDVSRRKWTTDSEDYEP